MKFMNWFKKKPDIIDDLIDQRIESSRQKAASAEEIIRMMTDRRISDDGFNGPERRAHA